jgi:hypothetical protein
MPKLFPWAIKKRPGEFKWEATGFQFTRSKGIQSSFCHKYARQFLSGIAIDERCEQQIPRFS